MADVVKRILETLRRDDVFLAALATVDAEGRPHVRTVRGRIDDDLTIRCATFMNTAKVAQIGREPRVALTCGDTEPVRPGTYLEIQGTARISTAADDRRRIWNERLEKWYEGPDDPQFGVVVIRPTLIEALPIGGGSAPQIWRSIESGGSPAPSGPS